MTEQETSTGFRANYAFSYCAAILAIQSRVYVHKKVCLLICVLNSVEVKSRPLKNK